MSGGQLGTSLSFGPTALTVYRIETLALLSLSTP